MSVTVLYIPVSTVKPHPQCSHGIFPRASDDISVIDLFTDTAAILN